MFHSASHSVAPSPLSLHPSPSASYILTFTQTQPHPSYQQSFTISILPISQLSLYKLILFELLRRLTLSHRQPCCLAHGGGARCGWKHRDNCTTSLLDLRQLPERARHRPLRHQQPRSLLTVTPTLATPPPSMPPLPRWLLKRPPPPSSLGWKEYC